MIEIKSLVNILLFILCIVSLGCDENEINCKPNDYSDRTVLVYLGVDNNFRDEAQSNITLLTNNWNDNNNGNLLVYADTGESPVLVHIYHNESAKCNVADTIEVYEHTNTANPLTLTRVLNDVKDYYPANSYGLVVLSHATGWLPSSMSNPSPLLRSVIYDATTPDKNNYMELQHFAAAIPYKLDFIIFDACFMGTVEVCYELKDKSDYIVASPAEIISPGFVYCLMMQHLFKKQADLVSVADDFYTFFNLQTGIAQSAIVSVVKTSELENLATVFKDIHSQSYNFVDLEKVQTFGYGSQKIYFDLGDYMYNLSSERYFEFQNTLQSCITYKKNTDNYYSEGIKGLQPIKNFSGLSVYVQQDAFPEANERYKSLKWAKRVE
jgi:hypothetical protein